MKKRQKKIIPEKEFYNTIKNFFSCYVGTSSYYLNPEDIPVLQIYRLTKEHIEYMFDLFENADKSILNPSYPYNKNGKKYEEYDMVDNAFCICNLLCGVIRDSIEDEVFSKDEAFTYLKRILNLFIKFHRISIEENYEYDRNHKERPKDSSWKKSIIYKDNFFETRYYITIPTFAAKYFSDKKEYISEIEKIIEDNIDLFTGYDFTYATGLNSFNYLLDGWQSLYPFSIDFMSKNYKYFYVPKLIKNKKCSESKEQLEIIFGKILEWNLSEIIRTSALGGQLENFKLSKEKINELILLFAAN